ncbi:sec7 domain containing protein [Lichtheimia corymbifera JMRC:FSU:9682]|uniref:Sec7 domain containing protein n=1 Tax=Lichtheimia corymbifera JMRC:FSU:9682 TaxID=1263082 RepID=A0A068RFZ2_9FUNG|nr:sec7 domain containing protein [Lichtheimia corymbifera JMRC:FSU:9682]
MLPNSRIVPPPSHSMSTHSSPTHQDAYRKRSLSAAAPPSHYHHNHNQQQRSDMSSSKQHSKSFLSRFRAYPQSNGNINSKPPAPYYDQQQHQQRPQTMSTSSSMDSISDSKYASRQRHASMISTSRSTTDAAATPNDAVYKKPNQKGAIKGGLGRIFRKLSRANDEDDDMLDDAPRVRPISGDSGHRIASRTPHRHNIPLAPAPPTPPQSTPSSRSPPPPPPPTKSTIVPDTTIADIPSDYLVRPPVHRSVSSSAATTYHSNKQIQQPQPQQPQLPPTPPPSSSSTPSPTSQSRGYYQPRKTQSPATYSIYSTFGPDPTNENASNTVDDLTRIVNTNVQRRTQTITSPSSILLEHTDDDDETDDDEHSSNRHLTFDVTPIATIEEESRSISESEKDDDDDDDESESEEDEVEEEDDVFVDATGSSQDDIEREKRLSKRLSGGHFGSAGGLMIATTQQQKQQKRRSRPPPEDIAQAMLNWKRHSGGAGKRFSGAAWAAAAADLAEKKPPMQKQQDEQHMDKEQVRQKAAEALTGKRSEETKKEEKPPQPTTTTTSKIAADTSKFLTDNSSFWKDTDTDLFQVHDPRLDSSSTSASDTSQDAKEAAQHLWDEDNVITSRERIAEWLGQGKPHNSEVLVHYMDKFEFANMRLDNAFRKLCSKLYFKAEAQQIDRILEVFANRYWTCNPDTILRTADVVYAVVYSVLLLNTDLHVAQGNYTRMTRQEFIRNTMAAVHDQRSVSDEIESGSSKFSKEWEADVEAYLRELYTSVKQYQILQPLSRRSTIAHDPFDKRGSILNGRRVVGLKRSVGSIIRRSTLVTDEVQPRASSSSNARPSSPSSRRESFSSIGSSTSFGSRARASSLQHSFQPMISFMEAHSSILFENRPPYIKEGVVMRKHLLENANQKAKHREWRECLLQVTEGELKMYALQSGADVDRRSVLRASSASFANLSDKGSLQSSAASFGGVPSSKWAASSQPLASLVLNHTLSNILPPPGYNRQRPHVFAIQQPDGGVYLFQTASQEQCNEWVATCNYWAARESKEPLPGGVSNMEYGWGGCLHDVVIHKETDEVHVQGNDDPDAVNIFDWKPPTPPLVSSTLEEEQQLEVLKKHLNALEQEIDDHRELKRKILAKFPSKSQNHYKAITNWEAKSKYLLHDIIKYQNYCDALEKSIQEQQKAAEKSPVSPADATDIHLDYTETSVDLVKEIGEELRAARILIT